MNAFHIGDKPSIFLDDKKFNGHNATISDRSRAAQDKKPYVPIGSINTETITTADKRSRLRGKP